MTYAEEQSRTMPFKDVLGSKPDIQLPGGLYSSLSILQIWHAYQKETSSQVHGFISMRLNVSLTPLMLLDKSRCRSGSVPRLEHHTSLPSHLENHRTTYQSRKASTNREIHLRTVLDQSRSRGNSFSAYRAGGLKLHGSDGRFRRNHPRG